MQKREVASAREVAFAVPFAWEEKPGVPKETHMQINIPSHAPNIYGPAAPLRKPPCLQLTPADHLCMAPNSLQARHGFSPKLLPRKQSLNHIPPPHSFTRSCRPPLARKYSLGNLFPHGGHPPHSTLQDDPFFMAFRACQKESISWVYFHNGAQRGGGGDASAPPSTLPRHSRHHSDNFKPPLTIRELCTLQLHEEAQRQPLIVSHSFQRKHKKGLFSCISWCLGC